MAGKTTKKQLKVLKDGPKVWNRWRRAGKGRSPELAGARLAEYRLRGANLSRGDFEQADLGHANASGASFRGADLTEASLHRARLEGTDFRKANLREASLHRCSAAGADFSGARLVEANLLRANLSHARFAGANLRSANLLRVKLEGADLQGAKLVDAFMVGANLRGADLRGADLTGAVVEPEQLATATIDGETRLPAPATTDPGAGPASPPASAGGARLTTDDPRFRHERMLDRRAGRDDPALWTGTSSRGMVVTAHYLATEAGVRMLEHGGNAVDAAVASSLALAVCESAGSGLGGMAMMLLHDPASGRVRALPGPCRAPALATPAAVAVVDRYRGYTAIAVPTLVAVLRRALAGYGRLPERAVLAPAIALAREGFPRSPLQEALVAEYAEHLTDGPLRGLFLDAAGLPLPAGMAVRQPALAATLEKLEKRGLEDFHRGGVAREIAADIEAHGGFVRLSDLDAAADPREAEPIEGRFAGETVATMGPPGGGLALLQMLHLLDAAKTGGLSPDNPGWSVLIARIIGRARKDRRRYRLRTGADRLGDAAELLDPGFHQDAARTLTRGLAGVGETSHVCTMDDTGLAVSMTQSIERSFGAGVGSGDLGFLYNGYLRGFKVKNQRHPHFLTAGAPARSNAAPAMVMAGGRPRVVVGSTGSERATSGILQVLARLRHQSPFEASHAPRLHCTPEGEVPLEADRFAPEALHALTEAGLRLEPLDPYSFTIGGLQLIVRDGERLTGVSEPRRDGAAAGPGDARKTAPA